jgi:hypothetical protein
VEAIKADRKLTLRLNGEVIDRAKQYASDKGTSLSRLTEEFLRKLTQDPWKKEDYSPAVRKLIGVIQLPADYDYKADKAEHLLRGKE